MARRPRRTHSATFKAQVAVAGLLSDKAIAEIAQKFEVQPNHVRPHSALAYKAPAEYATMKAGALM
jgi:transposase-like protein